jgi:hypothetical protein
VRFGVDWLGVASGMEGRGEGQAHTGVPGMVAVMNGRDHAEIRLVEAYADLFMGFTDDAAYGVFLKFEFPGWKVPLAVGVSGAITECQQDVILVDE